MAAARAEKTRAMRREMMRSSRELLDKGRVWAFKVHHCRVG